MSYVETKIISAALRELADTIECDDGVANMACLQAADRLDELDSCSGQVLPHHKMVWNRIVDEIHSNGR